LSAHRAQTTRLNDGIIAIDTEYARPLQDASHLIVEDGHAAFVDTGTNNSVPLLIDALHQQDLDVADVDYVFLTHIHLDHAGGAGLLMQELPNAVCVVHPRGITHMIDPTRLIAGTEAVYGVEQTQQLYGDLQPIEASRCVAPEDEQWFDLNGRQMQALYTEGHALHHYSLNDPASHGVFTGDSFGISYRELDTSAGALIFPTSTPTHFDPDAAHVSIDRIMGCNPEQLYLTHYSRVRDLDRLAADMHASIDVYAQMALANKDTDDPQVAIQSAMSDCLKGLARAHGYKGGDDELQAILEIDIELNAKGLVTWLQRLKKQGL
jgi:glyoxylase-like metal-dependent hydrolase (beta-lactamase superfamily II)